MIEMTSKGIGEVYREYYDKMAEKGKSRRLCEILATIYTRRYFDTVLDIYNGEHNPKHKKEHGELFRITYQEYYDKARENYYAYKNEPLIRYLAATYAEAYEEKRREHGEIRYALDFAEGYISTYGDGFARGMAEVSAEMSENFLRNHSDIQSKMTLWDFAEVFDVPKDYLDTLLNVIRDEEAEENKSETEQGKDEE